MKYSEYLDQLEIHFSKKLPRVMAQVAAQRVMSSFYNQLLDNRKEGITSLQLVNSKYSWDLTSDTLKIGASQRIKYIALIPIYFLQVMLQFVSRGDISNTPMINILYGTERERYMQPGKFNSFAEYLSHLSSQLEISTHWLVENNYILKNRKLNDRVITSPCPLVTVLLSSIRMSHKFRLFARWAFDFAHFLIGIPFNPDRIIVANEYVKELTFVQALKRLQPPINLFTTTSQLFVQPLFFHKENNHSPATSMIWYSSSAHDQYVDFFEYIDYSIYSRVRCDTHLVWTSAHKEFLERKCGAKARVIGPQLFYRPSLSSITQRKAIAIFDITPTSWKIYENTPYGTKRCLQFLEDVFETILKVNSKLEVQFQVEFKAKREFQSIHSQAYIDQLNQLGLKGLSILPSDVNLFDYLNSVSIVVTNSLTSIGDLAEFLGIEVIYYDLENFYSIKRKGQRFALNRRQLFYRLNKLMTTEGQLGR